MNRRRFFGALPLGAALAGGLAAFDVESRAAAQGGNASVFDFELDEVTIDDLHRGMQTGRIGGWSGTGGFTRNPYVLDRNPQGSSSGSAVGLSANLCTGAVGTDTGGSVTYPASANGVCGLRPTMGLVSRAGIIPLSLSRDTAGPMARTVSDTAILLGGMAGMDSDDAVTS